MLIEILKIFWQLLIVVSDIAIKIIATSVIIGFIILQQREKKYILVDFDSLTNIEPILERCRIWLANNKEKNPNADDYFAAHISEQQIIPNQILNCLRWQGMGYSLIYISERKENLRIESAKVLNDWNLKGELFLTGSAYNKDEKFIELKETHKIKGLIALPNENSRQLAEILKTERL